MSISNNPPPLAAHGLHIDDLIAEATNHLDGDPITTQGQADAIGVLLESIRVARKAADDQRAVEKKPHDDAGKAVQAAWKPLLEKCDTAATVAKRALTPWLHKLEDDQKAAAARLHKEAEEARQKLIAAHQSAPTNLAAAQEVKALEKSAGQAQRAANKAEKAKPQAAGLSRSIGLRKVYRAEITDRRALLNHYAATRADELTEWLQSQADADVYGGMRVIPGVLVHEDRNAA